MEEPKPRPRADVTEPAGPRAQKASAQSATSEKSLPRSSTSTSDKGLARSSSQAAGELAKGFATTVLFGAKEVTDEDFAGAAALDELNQNKQKDGQRVKSCRLDHERFRGLREEIEAGVDNTMMENCMAVWSTRFITFTIIVNAVTMGMAAERKHSWMPIAEHIFTAIFAIEMLVKLKNQGCKGYFMEGSNRLDFALSWLSIIDNWIVGVILAANVGGTAAGSSSFLTFRLLRLTRIFRLLRLLSVAKDLAMIVAGLLGALWTMCWISVLLVIICYASGLFCKAIIDPEMYAGTPFEEMLDYEQRFGSVTMSMLTMLNMIILDVWGDVLWPVYHCQSYLVPFFFFYLMFTTLGVLNVVVGVVTDTALKQSKAQQELELEAQRRQRMRKIMLMADALFPGDGTSEVTADQLEELAESNADLMGELTAVHFPRGFNVRELHLMFDEEYNGRLSKEEFINGMFRLIFNNDFQRDCCTILHIAQVKASVAKFLSKLQKDLTAGRPIMPASGGYDLRDSPRATNAKFGDVPRMDMARTGPLERKLTPEIVYDHHMPTFAPVDFPPMDAGMSAARMPAFNDNPTWPLTQPAGMTRTPPSSTKAADGFTAASEDLGQGGFGFASSLERLFQEMEASLRRSEGELLAELARQRGEIALTLAARLEPVLASCPRPEIATRELRAAQSRRSLGTRMKIPAADGSFCM